MEKATGFESLNLNPVAFVLFRPYSSAEKDVKSAKLSHGVTDSRPEEHPPTKRLVAGSNPATGTTLTSPVRSANCEQGLNLGLAPKAGFLRPLSFWTQMLEESKVQSDVPQLAGRNARKSENGLPLRTAAR